MLARRLAPLWAERGYAAVGVPYYSPGWPSGTPQFPALPQEFANLPLDLLINVRDALLARGDIDGERIALLGKSKGAERARQGSPSTRSIWSCMPLTCSSMPC